MIEIPMDIFRNTGETALVCGFTRSDGMWQLVAVTSTASQEGPSTLITRGQGREPKVTFYWNSERCDEAFIAYTDKCLADGYEFMGQVEATLPPLEWDPLVDDGVAAVKNWARRFLRSASFELERQSGMDWWP